MTFEDTNHWNHRFSGLYISLDQITLLPPANVFSSIYSLEEKGLEISFFLSIFQLVATWRYPSLPQLPHSDSSIHGSVFMLLGCDLQTCYFWLWKWFGSRNTVDSSKKIWQISHTFSHTTKFLSVCERDVAGISEEEQFRVRISKFLWTLALVSEFASHELYKRYWRGLENCVHTHACVCVYMCEPTTLLISVTTVPLLVLIWLLWQLTCLWQ